MATNTFTITAQQRGDMLAQIGMGNVLSISGGRVTPLPDGIELPVSAGYRVRVHHTPIDDYTVERVLVRGDTEFPKGTRDTVYADQLGETAYRAGMFRSYDETEW